MMAMFDKIVYETVWNVVGRFHQNDFKKLEEYVSVDRHIQTAIPTHIIYIVYYDLNK